MILTRRSVGGPLLQHRRRHIGIDKIAVRSTNPTGEKALFGENFGARDPTAAEIESNFGEKAVCGNWDTAHIIK